MAAGRWDQTTTTWTPSLFSDNGAVNLGTGGYYTGNYTIHGGLCRVELFASFGSGCNLGTGNLRFTLPFTNAAPAGSETRLETKAWAPNAGGDFIGFAFVVGGDNVLHLFLPQSGSTVTMQRVRNTLNGGGGQGFPSAPGFTWDGAGNISAVGWYPVSVP